jgi:hypothetical protein
MASSTLIKYGNDLTDITNTIQPGRTMHIDAYGLAQAQVTYAVDTSQLSTYIDILEASIVHPDSGTFGFTMRSYKYSYAIGKGSVTMITVDFAGIDRSSGYTDAQINGVSTSSAQPIETHPNFTKNTDTTIGPEGSVLAGTPGAIYNRAIFNPVDTGSSGGVQYTFGGFGVETDTTKAPNKKAGVRQFLRPMQTFRGQMFFDASKSVNLTSMLLTVGRTFNNDGDVQKLLAPFTNTSIYAKDKCLLTAANVETIGSPVSGRVCAFKVNYDVMFTPYVWDADIYGKGQTAIF